MILEQCNSDGGAVEEFWWNSRTVMVEQWNNDVRTINRGRGTVEQ